VRRRDFVHVGLVLVPAARMGRASRMESNIVTCPMVMGMCTVAMRRRHVLRDLVLDTVDYAVLRRVLNVRQARLYSLRRVYVRAAPEYHVVHIAAQVVNIATAVLIALHARQ
jgi:hypothetical protein